MTKIINTIIIVFVIILTVFAFFCQNQASKYKKEVLNYQIQLEALKQQSEVANQQAEEAKQKADKDIQHLKEQTEKIIKADVPKDCNSAMRWAIAQAKDF